MPDQKQVDSPSIAYEAMAAAWNLLDDLRGGTAAMRDAGQKWLPRSEGEEYERWVARRDMSFLFNAYGDTLKKIGHKPFSKPATVRGELPPQLAPIAEDVDRAGRDLTQFAKDVLTESTHRGLTHVFVDFPEGQSASNQDEVSGRRRPYFVHIPASDLLAWRFEKDKLTGEKRLTHIRWRSTDIEQDGEFGEKEIEIIHVWNAPPRDEAGEILEPGTWEKWRKADGENEGKWSREDTGTHMFPGIPLLTFYANRTGFMTAEPPLKDLAWQTLRHWQSSSEQNNILHVARVPILFRKGWPTFNPATGEAIKVSITDSAVTQSTEADMKWVEPAGHAIKSGEEDLGRTEERMEILGAQPFMRRTGTMVATGRAIDNAESNSMVKSLVIALELFLADCWHTAAQWLNIVDPRNVTIPEDFGVDIFSEFGLSMRATEDIEALIKARTAKEISRETFLREIKKRGLLSDTVDVEDEIERLEEEGPPLEAIGMLPDDDDGDKPGSDVDARQDEEEARDVEAVS